MEIKLFYKTQRELAATINTVVDAYWNNSLDEHALIQYISDLYKHNNKKFMKQNDFTTILKQQCGKRRLEVVVKILEINGVIFGERMPVYMEGT